MTEEERKKLQADIDAYEIHCAGDRWKLECRHCGKTPADIGWCDDCGYNRQYAKIRTVSEH
jgi:rRNA maturation endonuclease Nob1